MGQQHGETWQDCSEVCHGSSEKPRHLQAAQQARAVTSRLVATAIINIVKSKPCYSTLVPLQERHALQQSHHVGPHA